jgi:hypothetical protein
LVPVEFFYSVPAILLLVIFAVQWSTYRYRLAFQGAADAMDLTWESQGLFSPGAVRGMMDDNNVRIGATKRGFGSFERILTEVEVSFPRRLDHRFVISREHLISRLGRVMGKTDIEIGNDAFDDELLVECSDEDWMRSRLTPDAARAIVAFLEGSDDIRINESAIVWQRAARITDPQELVLVVERGRQVAGTLQHPG